MSQTNNLSQSGVIYALCAYVIWGIAPLYLKMLKAVPADEILMHRIVWSVCFLLVIVFFGKHAREFIATFASKKTLFILAVSGLLLSVNWLLFIWAVNQDHLLDASLGYFINPLVNILFGFVFLQERFNKLQWLAVGLTVLGVVYLLITRGTLPWIALVLAVSFSIYGLLRKQVRVGAVVGLSIETLFVIPISLFYWFSFASQTNNLVTLPTSLLVQLIVLGLVTIAPLLCFIAAARRLQYTTIGFFQYISPSIMFVMATCWFDEPLDFHLLITFICVWLGLILFTYDGFKHKRA